MNTAGQNFLYSGSEQETTEHAAALIIAEAYRAVSDHGCFSFVLAGGKSPRPLYRQLALGVANNILKHYALQVPQLSREKSREEITFMPWEKTWLFWGDERCVPVNHQDSNYRMAKEELLSQAPISEAHIFRMTAEQESGKEAARKYEESIHAFFHHVYPHSVLNFPVFDLVILGLGEDGHTASLFAANTEALQEKSDGSLRSTSLLQNHRACG